MRTNTQTTLLGKVLFSPNVAQTLARHKTTASNPRLLQDLIRFGPGEKANPAHQLEEWRTIALLACDIGHDPESNKNLGHLLRPGDPSEKFLQLLQKASGPRAAKLIAQKIRSMKKEGPINLYWTATTLLKWQARREEEWVRWAKAFYLTEGDTE